MTNRDYYRLSRLGRTVLTVARRNQRLADGLANQLARTAPGADANRISMGRALALSLVTRADHVLSARYGLDR